MTMEHIGTVISRVFGSAGFAAPQGVLGPQGLKTGEARGASPYSLECVCEDPRCWEVGAVTYGAGTVAPSGPKTQSGVGAKRALSR
jgi:hypothetical protein